MDMYASAPPAPSGVPLMLTAVAVAAGLVVAWHLLRALSIPLVFVVRYLWVVVLSYLVLLAVQCVEHRPGGMPRTAEDATAFAAEVGALAAQSCLEFAAWASVVGSHLASAVLSAARALPPAFSAAVRGAGM